MNINLKTLIIISAVLHILFLVYWNNSKGEKSEVLVPIQHLAITSIKHAIGPLSTNSSVVFKNEVSKVKDESVKSNISSELPMEWSRLLDLKLVYPTLAIRQQIEGDVILVISIEGGKISGYQIEKNDNDVLNDSIIEAMKTATVLKGIKDGNYKILFKFRLK